MCSRYENDQAAVLPNFDIDPASEIAMAAKWGEIRPTDPALVISYDTEPLVRRWGLKPDWAERPIINAKAEEAAGKKTFQPLLANRCVIPATAYFEWRIDGGRKIKTRIAPGGLVQIAGLVDAASFVMFTCAAAPGIAHIHHRMPAILSEDAIDDWLDPDADFVELRPLLVPFPRALAFTDAAPPTRAAPIQHSLF
jgi:putative SOS response-associated peptidase YedK